jgi:hypothetical protein
MDSFSCDSCFNEQRSYNDILKQLVIDVQKISNTENKKFAICANGRELAYYQFTDRPPSNTVQIIIPM